MSSPPLGFAAVPLPKKKLTNVSGVANAPNGDRLGMLVTAARATPASVTAAVGVGSSAAEEADVRRSAVAYDEDGDLPATALTPLALESPVGASDGFDSRSAAVGFDFLSVGSASAGSASVALSERGSCALASAVSSSAFFLVGDFVPDFVGLVSVSESGFVASFDDGVSLSEDDPDAAELAELEESVASAAADAGIATSAAPTPNAKTDAPTHAAALE